MSPKIERLKARLANRSARHAPTADVERELIREVVKQLRRENRDARREKVA
jgi:hypothetical protein